MNYSISSLHHIVYIIQAAILLTVPTEVWSMVSVGDSPDLEFTAVSGVKVDRQYLKGKLVIVDFWASWCSPCIATLPNIRKIHSEYSSQRVEILGINSDKSIEAMSKSINDQEVDWLQYYDQGAKLGRLWGISGIPALFLLSPAGNVLWKGSPAGLNWQVAKAMKEYFGKAEMLNDLKKKTVQAVSEADKALNAADYAVMLTAFENMESGTVEDREILKVSESLFNRIKMIQDKGRVEKIQAAIKADREAGHAFFDMLAAIDEALRVQSSATSGTD